MPYHMHVTREPNRTAVEIEGDIPDGSFHIHGHGEGEKSHILVSHFAPDGSPIVKAEYHPGDEGTIVALTAQLHYARQRIAELEGKDSAEDDE